MHKMCDPASLCGGIEGIYSRKLLLYFEYYDVNLEKVPAKFVPAAAVTRMGQVLFTLTRRKGLLGG